MSAIAVVRGPVARIDAMLDAVPHRGPVREVVTCGDVVLGIRSGAAGGASVHQQDGWAAAIAGTLDATDQRSINDAAAAIALLREHGASSVDRLRGAFAGAVTDGHTVWLFRDHFGSRPLFVHLGDRLVAATEVKQVVAGAGLSRRADLDHLTGLIHGSIDTSTAVAGVRRVRRGSAMTVAPDGAMTEQRYWDPLRYVETSRVSLSDALDGVTEHLDRAVGRAMRGSDVVLLSGGLDSPAVAASAVRAGRIDALTARYPDHPTVDESAWTSMVADHLGLELRGFDATAASLDDVEPWTDRLDGPVTSMSVPESAEAYRHAAACGATTVITGEVAEYVFECHGFLIDHLLSHGRLRAAAAEARRQMAGGVAWTGIARHVASTVLPASLVERIWLRRGGGGPSGFPNWIDPRISVDRAGGERTILGHGPGQRWIMRQVSAFEGAGVGLEMDEICAAHCGVEVRRPFADIDLWRFVLSLPAEVKFPESRPKSLLREAMRGRLPDALLDRADKTYFDEFHHATADLPTLKRFLVEPGFELPGIDYRALSVRIDDGDLSIGELQWARDLVRIHAFVGMCA